MDAGVRYVDVQSAETRFSSVDEAFDIARLSDVACDGQDSIMGSEGVGSGSEAAAITCEQGDAGAFADEQLGDAAPDPGPTRR